MIKNYATQKRRPTSLWKRRLYEE